MTAVLVFWATRFGGVIVSPDSVNYVAASRSFAGQEGFLRFEEQPLTKWPPLYPLLLGLLGWLAERTNRDLLEWIRSANMICAATVTLLAGRLLYRLVQAPLLRLGGLTGLAFCAPLVFISVHAWTEPLFVLLLLLFVNLSVSYWQRPHIALLGLLALLAALASLQRYIGGLLIGVGGLLMLLVPVATWKQRLARGLVFGLLASLPLALWLLHNAGVSDTVAVDVTASVRDEVNRAGLSRIFPLFAGWYLPSVVSQLIHPLAGLTLLVLAGVAAIVKPVRTPARWTLHLRQHQAVPLVLMIWLYTAALAVITRWLHLGGINDRFFVPVYPLLLIVILFAVEQGAAGLRRRYPHWPTVYCTALFAGAAILCSVKPVQQTTAFVADTGAYCCRGFSLGQSSVIAWLQQQPLPPGRIYSNTGMPLFFVSEPVFLAPQDIEGWQEIAANTVLIWMENDTEIACFTPRYCEVVNYDRADLARHYTLEPYFDSPYGGVYVVRPR